MPFIVSLNGEFGHLADAFCVRFAACMGYLFSDSMLNDISIGNLGDIHFAPSSMNIHVLSEVLHDQRLFSPPLIF